MLPCFTKEVDLGYRLGTPASRGCARDAGGKKKHPAATPPRAQGPRLDDAPLPANGGPVASSVGAGKALAGLDMSYDPSPPCLARRDIRECETFFFGRISHPVGSRGRAPWSIRDLRSRFRAQRRVRESATCVRGSGCSRPVGPLPGLVRRDCTCAEALFCNDRHTSLQ